jgi:hypothetical protein
VQAAFGAATFLWGFILAWKQSGKTGDKDFVQDQRKAMKRFDAKKTKGPTATAARAESATATAPVAATATPMAATATAPMAATATALGAATATASGTQANKGPTGHGKSRTTRQGSSQVIDSPASATSADDPRHSGIAMLPSTPSRAIPARSTLPAAVTRHPAVPQSPATLHGQYRALHGQEKLPAARPPSIPDIVMVAESEDSGDEYRQEEDELTDSAANRPKEIIRRKPQRGEPRATPCSRCAEFVRICYDRVNGKKACYDCGKLKVRCEGRMVGKSLGLQKGKQRTKGKGRKAPKSRQIISVSSDEDESPQRKIPAKKSGRSRLTREQKGKWKGEFFIISCIYI